MKKIWREYNERLWCFADGRHDVEMKQEGI